MSEKATPASAQPCTSSTVAGPMSSEVTARTTNPSAEPAVAAGRIVLSRRRRLWPSSVRAASTTAGGQR